MRRRQRRRGVAVHSIGQGRRPLRAAHLGCGGRTVRAHRRWHGALRARLLRRRPAAGARPRQRRAAPARDGGVVEALGRAPRVRRALGGRGAAQRARAQAADALADRRDGRRRDDVASREDRRRSQLGLPLRLGARLVLRDRRAPADRPARARPFRAALAAGRRRAHAPAPQRAVRPRRRCPRPVRGAPASGLPRLAPSPQGQHGVAAASARLLRRPARDGLDVRPGRQRPRPRRRTPDRRGGELHMPHLDEGGLRDLGARRPAALHELENGLLGRARPRTRAGRARRDPRRRGRRLAPRARADPRFRRGPLLVGEPPELHVLRGHGRARRRGAPRSAHRVRRSDGRADGRDDRRCPRRARRRPVRLPLQRRTGARGRLPRRAPSGSSRRSRAPGAATRRPS